MSAMRIEEPPDIETLVAAMHRRLIVWGRIELRRGGGQRQDWESDGSRQYFSFSPKDYSDAEKLSAMILQLPKPQHRLTLGEFYQDDDLATQWETYTHYRLQTIILPGLARVINAGLRALNHRRPEWERYPMVRPEEVDGIRLRAIRLLVNRELMTP